MDNAESLRLRCLELANSMGLSAEVIVNNAAEFERFIRDGSAAPKKPKSLDRQLTVSEIAAANRTQ